MKKILIFFIRIYQNTLSPFIGRNCKYIPTCPEYTIQTIEKYGALKGTKMGIHRICRCRPFAKGGYDPVV